MRQRGTGSVYVRGASLWIKFYCGRTCGANCNGVHREPSGFNVGDEAKAAGVLKDRLKEVAASEVTGTTFTSRQAKKLLVSELVAALGEHYKFKGKYSSANASLLRKVDRAFGHMHAVELTGDAIQKWATDERDAGIAKATVNRTLQALRRCYTLAAKNKKFSKERIPSTELFSEKDNIRQGFFEEPEARALLAELPDDGLRDFALFAFLCGWRRGSVAKLLWSAVDLDANEINLPGTFTKNGLPLKLPIDGELCELFVRRVAAATMIGGEPKQDEPVFHRGDHKAILEYRKSWQTAAIKVGLGKMFCPRCESTGPEKRCAKCKLPRKYCGRLLHDFRRTVARDLIRSGVSQAVAMKLTGHKTFSVFSRYNLTSNEDISDAIVSVAAYREQRAAALKAKKNVTPMPRRHALREAS